MLWRRELTWRPRELGWRIAVLFMVGSFLFALGSFPLYWGLVEPRVVGITFVVGSLFFTAAGYSTFFEVINSSELAGERQGTRCACGPGTHAPWRGCRRSCS